MLICATRHILRPSAHPQPPKHRFAGRRLNPLNPDLGGVILALMPTQWRRAAGSGVVGYNVQVAVDTTHHLIITHEVTNVGTDRSQLSSVAKQAKATPSGEPRCDR